MIGLIDGAFESAGFIDTTNHKVEALFQRQPIWEFILFSVVIVPFFEEVVFRLFLTYTPKRYEDDTGLPASPTSKSTIRRFPLIFYVTTIVFASLHLSNYELSASVLFLSPLLIAPQFIGGLFMGYLRIRYSFLLGYFMHAIHNAFFITLSYLIIKAS